MASSKAHYAELLAPVYSWMYGGFAAAVERNSQFFARHGIAPSSSGVAVDLGAGCGFQSIPLAGRGYRVTAIDLDAHLLGELEANVGSLPIEIVADDLLEFRRHVEDGVELAVCMTDTLLHLESPDDVGHLFAEIYAALEPGGRFLATFRDFTHALEGVDRFIPVRSDDDTIFTCFLEYEAATVKVHDLVYRRTPDGWSFGKSYYRKLRLSPEWVVDALSSIGFEVESVVEAGVATVFARKPANA
jgi:SAM-dependent methyltransferase